MPQTWNLTLSGLGVALFFIWSMCYRERMSEPLQRSMLGFGGWWLAMFLVYMLLLPVDSLLTWKAAVLIIVVAFSHIGLLFSALHLYGLGQNCDQTEEVRHGGRRALVILAGILIIWYSTGFAILRLQSVSGGAWLWFFLSPAVTLAVVAYSLVGAAAYHGLSKERGTFLLIAAGLYGIFQLPAYYEVFFGEAWAAKNQNVALILAGGKVLLLHASLYAHCPAESNVARWLSPNYAIFSVLFGMIPIVSAPALRNSNGRSFPPPLSFDGDESEAGRSVKEFADVGAFVVADAEVTQALFERIMGYNPSRPDYDWKGQTVPLIDPDYPVQNVSWFDALIFCNKLTVEVKAVTELPMQQCYAFKGRTGEPMHDSGASSDEESQSTQATYEGLRVAASQGVKLYRSRRGFRLPTEAEWEYAAHAGETHFKYAGAPDKGVALRSFCKRMAGVAPVPHFYAVAFSGATSPRRALSFSRSSGLMRIPRQRFATSTVTA